MAACEIPELSLKLTRSQRPRCMLCVEIRCKVGLNTEAEVGEEGDQVWPWAKGTVPFCTKAKNYSKSRYKSGYRNQALSENTKTII